MGERFIEKRLGAVEAPSYARVLAIARKMDVVINLRGGDPDFDTSTHIKEAPGSPSRT